MQMSKKRINHIPTDGECYRVFEDKAYFAVPSIDGKSYVYFQFESKSKAKEFKNNRFFKNTANKKIEDFMSCDDKGFFSHSKHYKLLKSFGIDPGLPMCLFELWAIRENFGLYLNMTDEEETEFLLSNVQTAYANRDNQRKVETVTNVTTKKIDSRLKNLCDKFKVDYIFADIFLEEIKTKYYKAKIEDEETRAAYLLGIL